MDIKCELTQIEYWDTDINQLVIREIITDRIGKSIEKVIVQSNYSNRFVELFDYLKKLNNVDTHKALEYLFKSK